MSFPSSTPCLSKALVCARLSVRACVCPTFLLPSSAWQICARRISRNFYVFLCGPLGVPKKKLSFIAFLRGLLGSLSRTGDDVDGIATHGGLYLLNTETTLAGNSLPRACRKAVIQRHYDKMYSSWRASYYANLLCSLGFLGLKKIVLPGIMPAM